ncbi:uncharacterized protein LOC111695821 [Eurytemora carolleeae]|uniref:uncharacterized protein LOC111695821 n=1 Tax=Eurytemora carolleeae TaxID=1294199 RepID=UPI000C761CE4|nr:uncharacterized protein LOC111695821 [Eurytemora carolleeae]|eukprot:XP_023321034.1 uncharacterized protein LOC111695821 [Eurytemora affinis]
MVARKTPVKKAAANGKPAAEMKVVDTVGEVEEVEMEEEEMEEIMLSSDDENEDDDVALIVLKRPPVTERIVEEVEITEDIEITGTGTGGVNLKEKSGFVKEYIESEGLAMILSKDYGLVLFHLSSVWLENVQNDLSTTRKKLPTGTEIKFYDRTFKGEEYKDLSEDKVIHQAVAVWTGETRPDNVLKKVADEEYKKKLEEHRATFMLYLRGEVFLRAAFVRVKGEVAGYLNENMGIIEYKDEKDKKINIFFHTDDVRIFKKEVKEYRKPAKTALPVGCIVSVDARRVHVVGVKNIEYQAIIVVAGAWPKTPHPTLMPGGQGSIAPSYEMPKGNFTFYYMELALEGKLTRKVQEFKDILSRSRGQVNYDWANVQYIQSKEQFNDWKREYGGGNKRSFNGKRAQGKREVLDTFRAAEATEEDIKDEKTKVTQKTIAERTWYTPEAWEHGGLRLKEEVKDETDGSTPAKRVKKELKK